MMIDSGDMFDLQQQIDFLKSRSDGSDLYQACIKSLLWLKSNETTIRQACANKSSEHGKSDQTVNPSTSNDKLAEKMCKAPTAAAIHCKNALFQQFIEGEWHRQNYTPNLPDEPDERCAQQVRSLCLVKSRADLAKFRQSFFLWQKLLASFNEWKAR